MGIEVTHYDDLPFVHVKRSRCACGHAFALKRKALLTADNQRELAKCRRAMEFVEETLQRQEQDRTHRASMRTSETEEQSEAIILLYCRYGAT